MIREIRRLHKADDPLNISAIKRNHPELLESAFAVSPFWGWKQAIEDAGLTYSTIRTYLEPYVQCELCGERMISLGSHLRQRHDISYEEYWTEFPGAPAACEELRARQTKSRRESLPSGIHHWEPLWSREYMLDRLWFLHQQGKPLNEAAIRSSEPALVASITTYCGTWREAILALGLDPDDIILCNRTLFFDRSTIIKEIRRRRRSGRPLDYTSLLGGEAGKHSVTLHSAGRRIFGSWREALIAAGVDPAEEHRQRMGLYENAVEVTSEIRRRHRAGLPLNHGAIAHGPHSDMWLNVVARREFGSWDAALMAAGLGPADVRRRQPFGRYGSQHAVVSEIKRRKNKGVPLNAAAIAHGQHRDVTLMTWAKRLFGSWNGALRAAGEDPGKIVLSRRNVYPDAEAVLAGMQERRRLGLPLNHASVVSPPDADYALYSAAKRLFGSWKDSLVAAGFDPSEIAQKRYRVYPDAHAVVEELRRRCREGVSVRSTAVNRGPHRDAALVSAARREFGSWTKTLKAAGVKQ